MDSDAHLTAEHARREPRAVRKRALLPGVLFCFTQTAAIILIALVFLAPLLNNGEEPTAGWRRLLGLFAGDVAVRRTAVASAIGLAVTANVFFRPRRTGPMSTEAGSRTPGNVVGA